MKYFFVLFTFLLVTHAGFAQGDPEPQQPNDGTITSIRSNRVFGKATDANSGKPVEAASAQLFITDSLGKESLAGGMLTRGNGDFFFEKLTSSGRYRIFISAIGFDPYSSPVQIPSTAIKNGIFNVDLGNIALVAAVQQLGGVTVSATRPTLEMGIDRKIFNASKSLVAAGGTAVDLMKSIPSVSVDVEGNVQLRNSTPQIFVDGRPTILTLDQIPADNIERIELITNPSARFDAASSGGIINIVLKKNKRVGLNGVVNAGAGTPSAANASINLNLRQGKFNIFTSFGYNRNGGKARSETERINKENYQPLDLFNQYTITERIRSFRTLRFGTDYFIDNRNTLGFTQQFGGGSSKNNEGQDQQYLNLDKSPRYFGERSSDGKTVFHRNSTNLNFKHNFPRTGQEFTTDVTYNYGNRSDRSAVINTYRNPDGSVYRPSSVVENSGGNSNDQVTFQADYVNPISESKKIEIGFRSYHNYYRSLYDVYSVSGAVPEKLPLSNHYKYSEMVNALYSTYSNKLGSYTYQLGLRAEYSRFKGELIDSSFKFGYEYPAAIKDFFNALFPSLFITRQLNEKTQLQFNYSRRIRRPDFWQLNPAIEVNDPANLRQGNLNLLPEFINSFELNLSRDYSKGNVLAVLYFRSNPDDITQISDTITSSQYEQLQQAGIDPNAILNTFINANTTNRYGAELTIQHKVSPDFSLTPSVNLQYRTVNANISSQDLSNEGLNWESKLIAEYKINNIHQNIFTGMSFQLSAEYESARVLPQGKSKPAYGADFALRRDLFKSKKGTITFAVNDIFNSQRWGTIYDTENFFQDSYRRWSVRSIRLTFSYRFGDADFSLSNKNRAREGGGE